MRHLSTAALLMCGTLILASCGSPVSQPPTTTNPDTTPKVNSVKLLGASQNLVLNVGQSQQLTAQVDAVNGASSAVTWKSSNPNVISVDANGVITAVAVGQASITLTSGADPSKVDTLNVSVQATQVTPQVKSVTIVSADGTLGTLAPDITLIAGSSALLRAVVAVNGGASQDVSWTVNDPSVASITQNADGTILLTLIKEGVVQLVATSKAQPNVSAQLTVHVNFGLTGRAMLSGDVVKGARNEAVAMSSVKVYKSGERLAFLQTLTDAQGHFSFSGLPAGLYDVTFNKANYAGSEVLKLRVGESAKMNLKVAQYQANDPFAPLNAAKLDFFKDTSGTPLNENDAFTDKVPLRATTSAQSRHQKPLRSFIVSVGTFDAQGNWSEYRNNLIAPDPGYITPVAGGEDTGLLNLSLNGINGQAYILVSALDYNYNRVAYYLPIQATQNNQGVVSVPSGVAAVAYTLSEPVIYSLGIGAQAIAPGTNTWVTVSWNKQANASGFTVLRADQETGPYVPVARAAASDTSAIDNTATLVQDKDYFYKVEAIGSVNAMSASAYTHILKAFRPKLLSPGDEAHDVGLTPNYTIKNQAFEIGATGSVYDVQIQDTQLGTSYAWLAKRLQVRKGLSPDRSKLETQVLSNLLSTNYYYVYRDSNTTDKNLVTYDNVTNILTLPHQFDVAALGSSVTPLQTNRRYAWRINKAYAFKTRDDQGSAIVAYSIYSDPDGLTNPIVPGGTRQQYTESFDFTTKP